ncbi:MAG: hypothetical protein PUC26_02230 [Eubacteriales bacterium]|nr:hypothetical protein [Eubacteriales bacterium]
MRECKQKMPARKKLLIILLVCGFAAIEFPGILIVGRLVRPMIFGMPFLYGYLILCWIYMLVVFFYAWRTGWGRHPFTLRREAD